MKKKTTEAKNPPLATGQLWQLENCYVQIARVGKTLAEYKMLRKPGQKAVQSQMGSIESVAAYLKANKAKPVTLPVR